MTALLYINPGLCVVVQNSQEARAVKASLADLPCSPEVVASKKNLFEVGEAWSQSPTKGATSKVRKQTFLLNTDYYPNPNPTWMETVSWLVGGGKQPRGISFILLVSCKTASDEMFRNKSWQRKHNICSFMFFWIRTPRGWRWAWPAWSLSGWRARLRAADSRPADRQ